MDQNVEDETDQNPFNFNSKISDNDQNTPINLILEQGKQNLIMQEINTAQSDFIKEEYKKYDSQLFLGLIYFPILVLLMFPIYLFLNYVFNVKSYLPSESDEYGGYWVLCFLISFGIFTYISLVLGRGIYSYRLFKSRIMNKNEAIRFTKSGWYPNAWLDDERIKDYIEYQENEEYSFQHKTKEKSIDEILSDIREQNE